MKKYLCFIPLLIGCGAGCEDSRMIGTWAVKWPEGETIVVDSACNYTSSLGEAGVIDGDTSGEGAEIKLTIVSSENATGSLGVGTHECLYSYNKYSYDRYPENEQTGYYTVSLDCGSGKSKRNRNYERKKDE